VADNQHKHKISGPGAADFIAAPGGLDVPETAPGKGTGILRDDTHFTDPRHLEPNLEPADEVNAKERTILVDDQGRAKDDEQKD
jgi:hypothetical protein